MPKKPEIVKRWFIFCEPCSYKKILTVDDPSETDLVEIKTVGTPGGSPFIDPETKKVKAKPTVPRPKKFKCPKCGRGVAIKQLPEVYSKAYKAIDEDRKKRDEEFEKKKRIEDGKPIVRDKEEEFLG